MKEISYSLKLTLCCLILTRFYIYFDIEPFRYDRENFLAFHLGLINDNLFTIQEYIVPEIEHHK